MKRISAIVAVGFLLLALQSLRLSGAEAVADFPDPLIPNVQMPGELRVMDAASTVVNITFPSIPGMTIDVGDSGGSIETRIVNGKASTTRGIPLLITARIKGPTVVPPMTVRLQDGTALTTPEFTVQVDNGNPNLTGEAYAEAAYQPAVIVPGEATKLVYRIYLRRGTVEALGVEPPAGSIPLGERQVSQSRTFDPQGRPWQVFTITWPLTVATPGTYEVSGQQDYQVAVGDGFFDTRTLKGRVPVAPNTLTVKPLPSDGRPDDFTGLIGPLTLSAELDRPRISAGEGVELRITAAGRQVDLLKAPVLNLATGVQAYPKTDGKAPDRGTRIFRFDLVPGSAGDVAVPSVSIPYFDPEAKVYRRADSRALTLTVTPGRTRELGLVAAPEVTPPTTAPAVPAAQPGPVLPNATPTLTPLPPPLRGDAPQPPSPRTPLLVGLACLVSGGLLALIRLLLARRPAAHRGRALATALSIGDLDAAAFALASLRPSLTTDPSKAAAMALEQAIDRARFGGQALADTTTWLRELEKIS